MEKRKTVFFYTKFYCLTVFVCLILLIAGTFVPQSRVDIYVQESSDIMIEEGCYPRIVDYTYGSRLDNWTDALILSSSKAMSNTDFASVLTNPLYGEGEDPVERLYHYAHNDNLEPTGFYSRYWMGFRWVMRFALAFANYYQLKRYLAFFLFALFSSVISLIAQKVNIKTALSFAVSILLVRPYIICNSVQFSICFVIAFLAMLCIPWVDRNPKYEKLFFMEVGMITMYFDFYTTPIITLGLPLVFLYVMKANKNTPMKCRDVFADAFVWFAAYVAMWITKLILTSALTSLNSVDDGFASLFGWLGVNPNYQANEQYNAFYALGGVAYSLISDREGFKIAAVIALLGIVSTVILAIRKKINRKQLLEDKALLLVGLLPIVWFVVASSPTAVHFWFQYRSIAMTFWAIAAYLSLIFEKDRKNRISP